MTFLRRHSSLVGNIYAAGLSSGQHHEGINWKPEILSLRGYESEKLQF